jgi:hypothetical protein
MRWKLIALTACVLVLPVGPAAGRPWSQAVAQHPVVKPYTGRPPAPRNPPRPAMPGGIDAPDPNHPAAGYRCSTERQLWVQAEPCPVTYLYGGSRARVRELPLSRQVLCRYMVDGIPLVPDSPPDLQAVQRRTLLRKFGCGA